MIIQREKIPLKGDSVEKILVNKARTICQLIFKSGKLVQLDIDPSEFGVIKDVKNSPVKTESIKKSPIFSPFSLIYP